MSHDLIFSQVRDELDRQDAKWGQQNHPSVYEELKTNVDCLCKHHNIPAEDVAKFHVEHLSRAGELTFTDILMEEISEAVCAPNETLRREELVQCAAVIINWIKAIDRRYT